MLFEQLGLTAPLLKAFQKEGYITPTPIQAETYVHLIRRTGRAGTNGIAISFCDGKEELDNLRSINKLIGLKIPAVAHPF